MTNDDLAKLVDTNDEWIVERTGIKERRIASKEEALSDIALPAARAALTDAGIQGSDIDLLIVATVTPDMMFPTTSAILADELGASSAGAYDLLAGCTGFMERGGFLGFELGADGAGGKHLWYPGSGSRHFDDPESFMRMNGREVFKFATRVMVSSARSILEQCGKTVADVDVYVPHQANKRIIDHAVAKLGVAADRTVVNVQKYGNTSSGSIPLALADARSDGRLRDGKLVLMTGMGAGLTWGSALIEWTEGAQ